MTTEERIAQIAQGFSQGVTPIQQALQVKQQQENSQNAQMIQLEAQRRQQALQAIDVAGKLSEQTGKYIEPGQLQPIIASGNMAGIGDLLKAAPATKKAEKEKNDMIRQQKIDALDAQYKQSQINKNNGAADKVTQAQMQKLGTSNAGLFNVKTAMDEALTILKDPKVPEDQKIKTGQSLFKLLNSAEGSDAVGAEEAKRLGSYLEYNIANFTQPGAFIGRDLGGFTNQVENYSKLLGGRIQKNEQGINQLKSGGSLGSFQAAPAQDQDAKMQRLLELRAKAGI